jgi:hypothetical protein
MNKCVDCGTHENTIAFLCRIEALGCGIKWGSGGTPTSFRPQGNIIILNEDKVCGPCLFYGHSVDDYKQTTEARMLIDIQIAMLKKKKTGLPRLGEE